MALTRIITRATNYSSTNIICSEHNKTKQAFLVTIGRQQRHEQQHKTMRTLFNYMWKWNLSSYAADYNNEEQFVEQGFQ